jgi:23S rRNA (guanosine2251-2'-O)-methyltransferase
LKKNDYWIYGATDKASDEVNNIDFKFPLALVIGGESKGLRQKTLESCDFQLKIDMKGVVESLNMAVATGIIINTIHSTIK